MSELVVIILDSTDPRLDYLYQTYLFSGTEFNISAKRWFSNNTGVKPVWSHNLG